MGVTWETRKIMDLPDLPVSCTCVRIPTLRAHGESITIETEKKIDMDRVYAVLNEASGVVVVDDTSKNLYPMPITASTKLTSRWVGSAPTTSSVSTASTCSSSATSCS